MAVVYSTGHFEPKRNERKIIAIEIYYSWLSFIYGRRRKTFSTLFSFFLLVDDGIVAINSFSFLSGRGGRKRVAALCPSSCLIADTKHKSCRIAWPGGEGTVTHSVRMRRAVIKEERERRRSKESIPFSPTPFRLSRCSAKMLHHSDTLAAAPYNVVCTYTVRKKGWRGV